MVSTLSCDRVIFYLIYFLYSNAFLQHCLLIICNIIGISYHIHYNNSVPSCLKDKSNLIITCTQIYPLEPHFIVIEHVLGVIHYPQTLSQFIIPSISYVLDQFLPFLEDAVITLILIQLVQIINEIYLKLKYEILAHT